MLYDYLRLGHLALVLLGILYTVHQLANGRWEEGALEPKQEKRQAREKQALCDTCYWLTRKTGSVKHAEYRCSKQSYPFFNVPTYCKDYTSRKEQKANADYAERYAQLLKELWEEGFEEEEDR